MRFLPLLLLSAYCLPGVLAALPPVSLNYRHAEPEKRKFYGRSSVPLKNGYRAEYNDSFRLVRVFLVSAGRETGEWRFFYSKTGQLRGCDMYTGTLRKVGWRYDTSGRIRKRIMFVGGGRYNRPFRVSDYFYDEKGQLSNRRDQLQGALLRVVQFLYHPTGEIFARSDYSITGVLQERTVFRTDDGGRIREALVYRWGRLAAVYVYRYSREGCPLGRSQRKPRRGDPLRDPLQERVKPLKGPG